MRCLYRERRYVCGDYLEVDIYPVFRKQGGRKQKAKPTSARTTRSTHIYIACEREAEASPPESAGVPILRATITNFI